MFKKGEGVGRPKSRHKRGRTSIFEGAERSGLDPASEKKSLVLVRGGEGKRGEGPDGRVIVVKDLATLSRRCRKRSRGN